MTPAARERAQVRVPLLIASAAAWAVLVTTSQQHSHPCHVPGAACQVPPLSSLAIDSLLMVAAMMTPLLTDPVRHIRNRSLARQRARSIVLFVAGYGVLWMAAATVLQSIALRAAIVESPTLTALYVCAAALWQCSPVKQLCLNRGHAHPELAPGGRAADVGALGFGVTHGVWCAGSCWLLMLLPLVGPGRDRLFHLAVMAVVSLWIAAERIERPMPREWRVRAPERALRLVFAYGARFTL